ncbi:MAG: Fic family protein [Oscillospiraceae bacterium]
MTGKTPLTYKIVGELENKTLKQMNWDMAIGLNKVDNLEPSKYLQELVAENVDGKIKNEDVEEALHRYYALQTLEDTKIIGERECDLVSTRIVKLFERGGFSFTPVALKNIHHNLFNGIYDFAGEFRTVNIYKNEPVLNGKSINYADFSMLDQTLSYDFGEEKRSDYAQMTVEEKIKHIGSFTSSIWQVHPFLDGNAPKRHQLKVA